MRHVRDSLMTDHTKRNRFTFLSGLIAAPTSELETCTKEKTPEISMNHVYTTKVLSRILNNSTVESFGNFEIFLI